MSENLLNIYYRETLDKVNSYEEYLSSMINTLDTQQWKKVLSADTQYAYKSYLYQYPNGIYKDEAQKKIDSFIEIEAKETDKRAWEKAKKKNSKKSYEIYLMSYYNGIYSNEAKRKVDEFIRLEKEIELEKQRLKEIERAIRAKIEKESIVEEKLKNFIKWADEKNIDDKIIPRDLDELKQLKILDLRYKYIKELPESIGSLKKVSVLSLGHNGLHKLPESISEMESLTRVSLWENYLTELPIWFSKLHNLKNLNLDNNLLESFPKVIRELKGLEYLSVGCGAVCREGNKIENIPDWIGDLVNLKSLNLSGLGLKNFNINICKLNKLTYLGLYNNELKKLPTCIGNMQKLESLGLNANDLSMLPKEMELLINLTDCYLGGNFSLYIENDFLKKLPKCIQESYTEIPGRGINKTLLKIGNFFGKT